MKWMYICFVAGILFRVYANNVKGIYTSACDDIVDAVSSYEEYILT